jgi:membrane-associated phospholipid phosphatase
MRMFVLVSWVLSLAVLAVGAGLVCPGGECGLTSLDQLGLGLANELRGEPLDRLMAGVTWLGSLTVLAPLAGLGAWWRWRAGQRHEAAFLPLALIGSTLLAHLAKLWVARPRPALHPFMTALPADWSYPSAHAMQVTAAALALFLILPRHRNAWPARWALAVLLGSLVILVGLSRIHLQVHFPSDVLAGGLAAALWVLGLHVLIFGRAAKSGEGEASVDKAADKAEHNT